jgi:hypothetical protein
MVTLAIIVLGLIPLVIFILILRSSRSMSERPVYGDPPPQEDDPSPPDQDPPYATIP